MNALENSSEVINRKNGNAFLYMQRNLTEKKRKACKINIDIQKKMHWPGIEPGPPAWQASILPLNHQCFIFPNGQLNLFIVEDKNEYSTSIIK
jgi:hypothetical protein